jgi:uncharacterized repeat protein (TIGR01451 family)
MFTCRLPFVFRHRIRHAVLAFLFVAYWLFASCPLQAASAVPFVDIVSPVSITPGSTGVIVTIRGAGFVASSVVHWNGTALVTTFVSAREMTATVPDAFVAAVGLGTITVISPAPGGGTSNVSYIPVASHIPVANFPSTPSSSVSVGTSPEGIATADFNADGKIDLAVANSGSSTVSILLGNGDGTFTAQAPVAAGTAPVWLVTGDFNEDGKMDLAVANSGSNTVSILLGNGDGTFTLHSSPSTGVSPFAIAAADFNADGHLDLAVTNVSDNTVAILLGNGNGTLTAGTPLAVGSYPQVLVIGDFNEDGKLDIAVANETSNSVSVLLGNGDGTFQPQTTTPVGGSGFPIGLIAGDFNGDSHLDVGAVNVTDVAILLGNGTGELALDSNPAAGSNLISGVTGDYNGDGFLDVVVADSSLGQAFLLPGNGNGTFGTAVTYTTSPGTFSAATADFNGDGALDLAFTNGGVASVSIFLQSLPVSLTPTSLAFGNQAAGTSSTAQVVTLRNTSCATVHISLIGIAGANALEFSLLTTCGASVVNASTCTISVTFSPTSVGAKVATLSVTDDAANSPQTLALSGNGTVTAQTISKAFGAPSLPLQGSTSLTFTIPNPSVSLALTGVAFSDNLPSGMVVSTSPGLITTCTGTVSAAAGASSVSLTAGTLAVSSSCTISLDIDGTTAGVKNSVTITSTQAGTGNTSNASVTVVAPPTLTKAFGTASIPLNGSTTLTFTVNNANSTAALSGIAFSDTLPAGLVISTPNGVTGACGGTITATPASNVVSLSGASIAASASCTFAVNVTGTSAGTQLNTTGAVTSTNGGAGNAASATLKVLAPLTPDLTITIVHKGHFQQGQTGATYTITVANAGTGPSSGAATVSDSLPAGLAATGISGSGWTCTVSSLACTRVDALAAGGSYAALTLLVNVAATAPGSVTDIVLVSGGGETNTANDTASDVTIVDGRSGLADFSIVATAATVTLNKGSKAVYLLTLTPLNNVPFAAPITLAVSGVPRNGTAFQIQPASVTPGANPVTSTLLLFTSTADTAIATNSNRRTAPLFALGLAFGMPLAGMVFAGLRRKNGSFNLKSPGTAILLFVLMGVACYGCASAVVNRNYGTPSGTYNLTVTATGGTVQHSVPLTLTVR